MANEEVKTIGGVKAISVAAPKTATGKDEKGSPTGHRKMEVTFDFGSDIENAIEKFGEDVVFAAFVASASIDAQNFIRQKLEALTKDAEGKEVAGSYANTDEAILGEFASWKPGIKTRERVSPLDKIKKMLAGMSDAQKTALLAGLGEE